MVQPPDDAAVAAYPTDRGLRVAGVYPLNIRLTCICAFAVAHSGGKVGAKVA